MNFEELVENLKIKPKKYSFFWKCEACNSGFAVKNGGVPEQFIIGCPICNGKTVIGNGSTMIRCSEKQYNECEVRDTW